MQLLEPRKKNFWHKNTMGVGLWSWPIPQTKYLKWDISRDISQIFQDAIRIVYIRWKTLILHLCRRPVKGILSVKCPMGGLSYDHIPHIITQLPLPSYLMVSLEELEAHVLLSSKKRRSNQCLIYHDVATTIRIIGLGTPSWTLLIYTKLLVYISPNQLKAIS